MVNDIKGLQDYRQAKEYMQARNWEQAVKNINQMVIKYPRVSELYHMKGICLSQLKGNELNAITNYNVSLVLTPQNLDCILDKCELLLSLKKLDEVELEMRSKIPPDRYNEKAFIVLGNYQSAKLEFKRAI